MFKFNFDLEELEDTGDASTENTIAIDEDVRPGKLGDVPSQHPFAEIHLEHLLAALPPLISYSPLAIPLSCGKTLSLARRDLFDARFQLISEGASDECAGDEGAGEGSALQFLDAPSDLVPFVYEGGLKTWECALDLVRYLDSTSALDPVQPHAESKSKSKKKSRRILEIGCGTAVPSLYLLHKIFAKTETETETETETDIHLQDYNASVLELVTLPNVLLTWYLSPASASYRTSASSSSEPTSSPPTSPPAPSEPDSDSELAITPALLAAFQASLRAHNTHLRFFTGSWDAFGRALGLQGGGDACELGISDRACELGLPYDLVLTSETVYRAECLPGLVRLMRGACRGVGGASSGGAASSAGGASSGEGVASSNAGEASGSEGGAGNGDDPPPYLCLVAAKVVYFGVGGGVAEFVKCVEEGCGGASEDVGSSAGAGASEGAFEGESKGKGAGEGGGRLGTVQSVWERTGGVGRRVMRVLWD
ncbi:hypothetical protein BV22DRAFT_1041576 [Leucogyrophana mollusca]|uniref:Uncharacterized protein n=1 Tax=Leucogyrophana mollusca TaxID=85980 RepID=A0ACB8B1D1_9AGAM|nr:hypothetical protein BV22DRAFT_1041576 [Leucogyrophana mollusca]